MIMADAVRRRLSCVTGLTVVDVKAGIDLGGVLAMDAKLVCRSPSLHPCGMRIRTTFADDADATIDLGLERFIRIQIARESASRKLGLENGFADPATVGHLVADGPLTRYEPDASSIALAALARHHRRMLEIDLETCDVAGPVEMASGFMVWDGPEHDPRPRVTMDCATSWGSYDGRFMHVACDVPPETLMVDAIGRRVDELVDIAMTHEPALEDVVERRILNIRHYFTPRVVDARNVSDVGHLALEVEADWKALA